MTLNEQLKPVPENIIGADEKKDLIDKAKSYVSGGMEPGEADKRVLFEALFVLECEAERLQKLIAEKIPKETTNDDVIEVSEKQEDTIETVDEDNQNDVDECQWGEIEQGARAMTEDLFYRSFELDRADVDNDTRSIELSFSSETPIVRWDFREILLHGSDNVDLSRLRKNGSALMNHNPNIIIGRVKGARVEDKKGRATLIFDEDADGNKALFKVQSGSLKGVSVGYKIEKMREVMPDEKFEGIPGPAMVATRWAPYEISLTPIPADANVGIGRNLTRSLDGIEIEKSNKQEEQAMSGDEIRAIVKGSVGVVVTDAINTAVPEIVSSVRAALAENIKSNTVK